MDGQPSTARIDAVLERVARRYRSGSRFTRHYVSGKLRRDPVHRDVLALAGDEGFGEVVDVGCGRGQLGLALLEAGAATRVLGLDRDFNKLAEAGRAASGLRFSAMGVDLARSVALPPADTVLLIDVLYQLPTEAQAVVLQAAMRSARRILIRTLDPDRQARSWLALAMERGLRRVLPNAGSTVNPQPIAWLVARLEQGGFTTTVTPCWTGTPLPNVLLFGNRTRP